MSGEKKLDFGKLKAMFKVGMAKRVQQACERAAENGKAVASLRVDNIGDSKLVQEYLEEYGINIFSLKQEGDELFLAFVWIDGALKQDEDDGDADEPHECPRKVGEFCFECPTEVAVQ